MTKYPEPLPSDELTQAEQLYRRIAETGSALLIAIELPEKRPLDWSTVWPSAVEWVDLLNEARHHTAGPFVEEPLPFQHMSEEGVRIFAGTVRKWSAKAATSPRVGLVDDRPMYLSLCEFNGSVQDNAPGVIGIEEEYGVRFRSGSDLAEVFLALSKWRRLNTLLSFADYCRDHTDLLEGSEDTVPATWIYGELERRLGYSYSAAKTRVSRARTKHVLPDGDIPLQTAEAYLAAQPPPRQKRADFDPYE